MKPFVIHKELRLPVSVDMLWDFISNTEHLNRMIGLPAVSYSAPHTSPDGTFRWAEGNMPPLGVLKWQEFPFEWVKPEGYRVRRVFTSGPFAELNGEVDVESVPEGSLVRVGARILPRNILGRLMVSTVGNKAVNDTLAYCKKAIAMEEGKHILALPMPTVIQIDKKHLKEAQDRLKQIAPLAGREIQRLTYLVVTCSDEEVIGMRPFALADRWRVPRKELLRAFLYATRAGLLEMEWKLKCPYCRVSKAGFRTLSELNPHYHCDFCGIDYTADLDLATELQFNVSPAIRQIKREIFCIGSPVNSPHVLCQQVLSAGETRTKAIKLDPSSGQYRIRVLRKNISFTFSASDEGGFVSQIDCIFDGNKWTADTNYFCPPKLEITLHNNTDEVIVVVFEDVTPDTQTVSAAFVTVLPEFRKYFNSEVLAAGRDIAVRRVCIMFTDLKGSTAMYEEIGDASAVGRVYKHFDFLRKIVERNNGSIVKVMGDAVMAVYFYTADGLRAALEIQTEVIQFNAEQRFTPPLVIKIGLHHGPVFAVNANDHLDYFGRTVNIASRLVTVCQGADVVCSAEVLAEPGLESIWPLFPVSGLQMELKLPGFEIPTLIYRLRLEEL